MADLIETSDAVEQHQRDSQDWTKSILAAVGTLFILIVLAYVAIKGLPSENKDAGNIIIGIFGGLLGTVYNYYFGAAHKGK